MSRPSVSPGATLRCPPIAQPQRRLTHEIPGGMISGVPWTILPCGNNLRVAIGEQEFSISTRLEKEQFLLFARAVSAAMDQEILP